MLSFTDHHKKPIHH